MINFTSTFMVTVEQDYEHLVEYKVEAEGFTQIADKLALKGVNKSQIKEWKVKDKE